MKDRLNTESDSSNLISVSRALPSDDYSSMKNKETRDSVSPSRHDSEFLDEEEESALLAERDKIVEALKKAGKTVKVIKSEIPIRGGRSPPQTRSSSVKKSSPQRKTARSIKTDVKGAELGALGSYFESDQKTSDILVNEEEEEMIDEFGNKVKMYVQTTKDKDGKEFTTRRTARTTKVVDSESDIDEILIGNPGHEIVERDVSEEVDKDGSKLKIITETRRRPDGIEYTTKNVLKTSKIFDYDHPEDVNHCDSDHLISMTENEETDENGVTIKTVAETRRKSDGTEYVTKKVYKTSKVAAIAPSDDDEIISTKETFEKDDEGNNVRVVIETRRKPSGEEYVYRQVFKSRRMTLTGVELQEGMPMMDNDDEVLSKKEKKEKDEHGTMVTIVTETRRRKDGSTYTFDYILRSFQGSKSKVPSTAKGSGSSNIKVSEDDELIKEEVKEEEQKDGSILKTIYERRRAKDGTEYLRHRIMKIPKIPEAQLTVGTPNDEVLQNDVEEVEYNGTHIKSITERRRSSLTGLQYTLRRMSKTYQQTRRPSTIPGDEIVDENVTEEEGDDGTVVKTVIRRYQRADGTMYTTHSVKKSFTSPSDIVLEDFCDGELLDQTIDQSETDDGYIVNTVIETYQKSNGVTYTVERSEKISKEDMAGYDKGSLITPQRQDVVLSQEIEEEPDDDGHVIKVTTEQRERPNGTKYFIKSTVAITPALIPEQETSFVVIKPDDDANSELLPSMDDELIYTRKREEKDQDGNPITVIIETRKSKETGEKYNITKRVFTTDILVTDKGEKVISRKNIKSPGLRTTGSPSKPKSDKISSIKEKFSSAPKNDAKTKPKEKPRLIRVNTADRRKLFENVPESKSPSTPKEKTTTPARKVVTPDIKSKSTSSTLGSKPRQTTTSRASKPEEPRQFNSPRKKPLEEKKSAPRRRVPDSSTDSAPSARGTTTTDKPTRSSTRIQPKETTPNGRQCCNKTHGSERVPETPKRTTTDRSPRKAVPTSSEIPSRSRELNMKPTKAPIVSMPQTPMTEEIKQFGSEPISDEPIIEDVSSDANIKEERVHRPSIVREPSDYPIPEDMKKQDDILTSLRKPRPSNESASDDKITKETTALRTAKSEPEKTKNPYEGRTPVTEKLIVPKYFHPLGDDDEDKDSKRRKPSLDLGAEMNSPKLIMRLSSHDTSPEKEDGPSRKNSLPQNDSKPSSKR